VTLEGIIPRKRKKAFEKFLSHPDARIRRHAQELVKIDVEERKLQIALQAESWSDDPEEDEICDSRATDEPNPDWSTRDINIDESPMQEDDDIPF
jgi:hypothetical protein